MEPRVSTRNIHIHSPIKVPRRGLQYIIFGRTMSVAVFDEKTCYTFMCYGTQEGSDRGSELKHLS